jgi:hypothetical protein
MKCSEPIRASSKAKKRKGGGLASPTTSAQALLAAHSPTRLAVTRGSIPAATSSGVVRTNANIEPSGAMNTSPCVAAPSLKVTVPVQFALTAYTSQRSDRYEKSPR